MEATPPFHQWLKRRRQAHGFTQDALADQVGCATQTIRKLEGGQRRPSFQMAQRLAQILAIPTAEMDTWMHAARADHAAEPAPPPPSIPSTTPPPVVRQLPQYFTPFVGRADECATVQRLLHDANCRLVTLLGAGGIGKTRLALEVARQCTDFADGVVFVGLAPIATPAALVATISEAVGLTFAPSATIDPLSQLLLHLRDMHALLVLDNLEHVLDADGVTLTIIDQMLQTAPRVQLLVTSRERLKLASEWVVEVSGLPVPPSTASLAAMREYAAVTLFVEHARRIQHTFQLDARNHAAIAAICAVLDGMPLGIELAAALVRVLTPDEIRTELTRVLDVPAVVATGIPRRHQSLRAVVEHSWQLLTTAERDVLARLAAFRGGFSREAASEVAGATLLILATLTDKSLVRRAADGRYLMHEMIRQYAETQLHANETERIGTHTRHADYYTRWLASRERAYFGTQKIAVEAEIVGEMDNLRAAWHWASDQRMLKALSRASEILQWFYEFRFWYHEGVASFEYAVRALDAQPDKDDPHYAVVLGKLLGHYAYLSTRIGLTTASLAAVQRSRTLLEAQSAPAILARTYACQGMIGFQMGDYLLAQEAFERALEIADKRDYALLLFAQSWYCVSLSFSGDPTRAEQLFWQNLALCRALGNPRVILWFISIGSVALFANGKFQEAEPLLRESIALASEDHDQYGMAVSLQHLGVAAMEQHNIAEAVYLLHEALELMRVIGRGWDVNRMLNQYAMALWLDGDHRQATAIALHVYARCVQLRYMPDALQAVYLIALYLHHQGEYAAALQLVRHILADTRSRNDTRIVASALHEELLVHVAPDVVATIDAVIASTSLDLLIQQVDRTGLTMELAIQG